MINKKLVYKIIIIIAILILFYFLLSKLGAFDFQLSTIGGQGVSNAPSLSPDIGISSGGSS